MRRPWAERRSEHVAHRSRILHGCAYLFGIVPHPHEDARPSGLGTTLFATAKPVKGAATARDPCCSGRLLQQLPRLVGDTDLNTVTVG